MLDAPLPPPEPAFSAVPNAVQVDLTELRRMALHVRHAALALNVPDIEALALRAGVIAGRNARNLSVLAVVREIRRHLDARRRSLAQEPSGGIG